MPSLTHYLGLNTPEGQRAKQRVSKTEPEQDLDRQRDVDVSINGEGRGDREGNKEEDKDVTNELLKSRYVRGVWKWVSENVK